MLLGLAVVATLLVLVEPKAEAYNIVEGMLLEAPRSPRIAQFEVLEPELIETPSKPEWTLDNCSCVEFVRTNSSISFERINTPHDLDSNYPPSVGGIILLTIMDKRGNPIPHMGLIETVFDNGMLIYADKMLINGECVITLRNIMIDDSRVDGFRI